MCSGNEKIVAALLLPWLVLLLVPIVIVPRGGFVCLHYLMFTNLSSPDMDLSPDEDPAASKLVRSFDEVWREQVRWGELRSPWNGRTLKKVSDSIVFLVPPPPSPTILFGFTSGIGPAPVLVSYPNPHVRLDASIPPGSPNYFLNPWVPSSSRRCFACEGDGAMDVVDLSDLTSQLLDMDLVIITASYYHDVPDCRADVWLPIASPGLLPDASPSVFPV